MPSCCTYEPDTPERQKLRHKAEAYYYAKYTEHGKSHYNAERAAWAMARRKYP